MRFGQTIERRRWGAILLAFLLAAVTLVAVAAPARAAQSPAEIALNEKFITWYDEADAYHLFTLDIAGFPTEDNTFEVEPGDTIVFGFEWPGDFTQAINLEIEGGRASDVSSGYQDPIDADPGVGDPWMWDHDDDGLGDGNTNGVDDWDGEITFFRYESDPILEETTFEFVTGINSETITVTPVCSEETCEFEDPEGDWEAEITCDGDCEITVNPNGDDVANITVDSDDPYKLIVTTTGQGTPPGRAEVIVDADDNEKDGVMEKCVGGNESDCVKITRVKGAHTQYCVFFDGEPNFRFR